MKSIFKDLNGAPGRIRTSDLLVRSQALYPTELRAREFWGGDYPTINYFVELLGNLAEREGFEPSMGDKPILP